MRAGRPAPGAAERGGSAHGCRGGGRCSQRVCARARVRCGIGNSVLTAVHAAVRPGPGRPRRGPAAHTGSGSRQSSPPRPDSTFLLYLPYTRTGTDCLKRFATAAVCAGRPPAEAGATSPAHVRLHHLDRGACNCRPPR